MTVHTIPSYAQWKMRLKVALGVNAIIIAAEFLGGFWIDSVGLMSDAGHNLIDQGALFLALYAHVVAARPASETRTFGLHRAGIVAAFVNSLILLLTALAIAVVAVHRLAEPVEVPGLWVIAIAVVSFIANVSIALLLQQGAHEDLNIRSAFWHMLGDAWVSLGVAAGGGIILLTGWSGIDALISLVVVGVILRGAWPIFRESLEVLLEATPPGISPAHVCAAIERIRGVRNVHDLHIWAVEPRFTLLSCHVLVEGDDSGLTDALLQDIRRLVTTEFGIHHVTIQMETQCGHPMVVHCELAQPAGQPAGPHVTPER